MEYFSSEFVVRVEHSAVRRKDHGRKMLARIGIRQLELEDQLNRLLNELGRVCQVLKSREELEGLG
jgi:hypothetical protein